MSEPIRIRSKDGVVIDLAYERKIMEELAKDMAHSPTAHATLAIVVALEAALRVPIDDRFRDGDPQVLFANGWNFALDAVNEAAGVIVEKSDV